MPEPEQGRNLLIVDDDVKQAKLFEHLLAELGRHHKCFHAETVSKALDFLRRQRPHENAPRPDLILLDVNMPGKDGCDTLRLIKADPNLRCIPGIMFSASVDYRDVTRCYEQHANAYIRKPLDLDTSLMVVQKIEKFWFHTARLPA